MPGVGVTTVSLLNHRNMRVRVHVVGHAEICFPDPMPSLLYFLSIYAFYIVHTIT